MGGSRKTVVSLTVAAVFVCFMIFLSAPGEAVAKSPAPAEGVRFDVSYSMKDNLKSLVGKDVYLHLRSGKTLQGYMKSVGDFLVHLEKLAGRDFFDALVKMEDISAVEVKFRGIK